MGDKITESKYSFRKVFFVFLGVIISGLGIAILRLVNWGVDPFSSMNVGLSIFTGVSFGTVMLCGNVIFIIIVLLTGRDLINVGTIANMFALGYACDFCVYILEPIFPSGSVYVTFIMMLIGVLTTCLGCSLYMKPALGAGPYDSLAFIIERSLKGKVSFKWCRIGTDVICVAIGFACGATIGVVTLVMAFLTGPVVTFYSNTICHYLVYGKTKLSENNLNDDALVANESK